MHEKTCVIPILNGHFFYNSFVKFHGTKYLGDTTFQYYIQICVKVMCVIKGLHFTSDKAGLLSVYGPVNEIFVLITYGLSHSLNVPAQLSSGARILKLSVSLHLCPYFVCAIHGSSGVHLCMLACVIATHIHVCNKFQTFLS